MESEHPQHPPGTSRGAEAPPLHRIKRLNRAVSTVAGRAGGPARSSGEAPAGRGGGAALWAGSSAEAVRQAVCYTKWEVWEAYRQRHPVHTRRAPIGFDLPAFDILSWNADGTNLPAALHRQFLNIFEDNRLPTPVDLGAIKVSA